MRERSTPKPHPKHRLNQPNGGQNNSVMKTLFLNPPSFEGFDGGAGARYQARREIRSFWYPAWLAQATALTPDSKLIDAPADDLSVDDVVRQARDYDLVILYTSTPSFANDARLAARIKEQRPDALIGFVGPHVTVQPEESLRNAPAVDFVVRREFDFTARDIVDGKKLPELAGVTWRDGEGIRHNEDAELITDLDSLPSVLDVYKRDLTIENYYLGYLLHPYISLYTGRGCTHLCTFCLWPQTVASRKFRTRSPDSVYEEFALAKEYFPQAKECFINDDTFTANLPRAEEIARKIRPLGVAWATNAAADVPYETLKILRESGLRLLVVGYESGSDTILRNVKKGVTTEMARRFTRDCKDLGIAIHGCFIMGLPGETRETIDQTIRFACDLDPQTIQISVVAPYPGTSMYDEAVANGWLKPVDMISSDGIQECPISYPWLSTEEILGSVDRFYRRFYLRPRIIYRIGREMMRDPHERKRRLREGGEFFSYLRKRRQGAKPGGTGATERNR